MKEKIFKDAMGRYITSGLFKETSQQDKYVIYTLDEARKLFLESNDPTGYLFSNLALEGYKHFLALKESPALEHHILQWEEELEIKLRSKGLQRIIDDSVGDKGYQAAKYLVEAGWTKTRAGRPSIEQIKKNSKMRSSLYEEFYDDEGRLKVVK